MRGIFESFGDHGPFLKVEGKKYRKVAPSTGRARTLLGTVEFDRPRYRPASGSGECFVPVPAEHLLGLTEGGQTQAAASLAMMLPSSLTPRECVDVLKRVTGEAPAISTLAGLAAKAGQCLEECSEEVMPELRKQEKLPENAAFFQTSLDGTMMMRMNAEKNGDDVTEEAGWREASCGVLSIFDNGGNKLQSRYPGRLPEKGKQTLKEQLRQEVSHIRSQNPDLNLVATEDGAKDNWTFLKSLNPDLEVLDFWHAAEYLKRAADAFLGADEEASMKWFKAQGQTPYSSHRSRGCQQSDKCPPVSAPKGARQRGNSKGIGLLSQQPQAHELLPCCRGWIPDRVRRCGSCKQGPGEPVPQTLRSKLGPGWRSGGFFPIVR